MILILLVFVAMITMFMLGMSIYFYVNNYSNQDNLEASLLCTCFCLIVLLILVGKYCTDEGYKQGQLDAHNNKYEYEFKIQPDSTRIWVEKEELKDE